MLGLSARVSTPLLDRWRAKLAGGYAQRVATRSARRQQARAREEAPVDTGALHVSISVITPTESDYGTNTGDAQGLRPTAQMFPAPSAPPVDSAIALVGAEHGALVNGGTARMAARPFWDQAVLETAAALEADADAEWRAAP